MVEGTAGGIGYIAGNWPPDAQKSTLIFIHGAGGSSLSWTAQVQGLAARVNTLAIDLPGHGRSGGAGMDSVPDYARAVVAFIQEINPPDPIPCGSSMGGAITQQLLLDYPNLVKAAILIGTGARLKVTPMIFEIIEKDYREFVNMIGKFSASKKTDPAIIEAFKQDIAGCKAGTTQGDFRACDRFDVSERLSSIDLPVLVVTAEDDMLTPPEYGEFLQKHIQKGARAHITEAGHIVPMEKPAAVNRAIIDFLDRIGG